MPPDPARADTAVRRASALRRAAVRAAQAPSVLNTQPWKLRIHDGALFVHADHDRQLPALDPQRRILTASVGCAVRCARAALAADGYGTVVRRFPEPGRPDLVAEISIGAPSSEVDPSEAAAPGRVAPSGTSAADVPGELVDALRDAVAVEGVELYVFDELERGLVAELNRQADEIENLDPTYRAELDAWMTGDRHGRDRMAAAHECFAVLVTDGDTRMDWLRAGEAMMRALDVASDAGQVLNPSTQVIEVAAARAQLRRALNLTAHPHLLLRVGPSRNTAAPRRRRLVDVLIEEA